MRRPELATLIHGPAELLPVSSSAHAELLGDRESATGAHLGSALALLLVVRPSPRRLLLHLIAGAIPSAAGWRLRGRTWSPVPGLILGSIGLVLADRCGGTRALADARARDGFWLGAAQACALVPGVSRNGATLVASQYLGFSLRDGNVLSREVGVPVSLGAAVAGGRPRLRQTAVAFAATLVSLPLLRIVDRGPLWPFAVYRCGLALALVRGSRR